MMYGYCTCVLFLGFYTCALVHVPRQIHVHTYIYPHIHVHLCVPFGMNTCQVITHTQMSHYSLVGVSRSLSRDIYTYTSYILIHKDINASSRCLGRNLSSIEGVREREGGERQRDQHKQQMHFIMPYSIYPPYTHAIYMTYPCK